MNGLSLDRLAELPKAATAFSLSELEATARLAAPGPWRECGHDRGGCKCRMVWSAPADGVVATAAVADVYMDGFTEEQAQANARFIAAANPAVILRLIAEIRRRGPVGDTLDYWPGI